MGFVSLEDIKDEQTTGFVPLDAGSFDKLRTSGGGSGFFSSDFLGKVDKAKDTLSTPIQNIKEYWSPVVEDTKNAVKGFIPALAQKVGGFEQMAGEAWNMPNLAESGRSLVAGSAEDAAATAPKTFTGEVIKGIVDMTPAIALAPLTSGASIMADMGLGGAGSKYAQLRQAGKAPDEAAISAASTGALYSATSLLPIHYLLNPEMGALKKVALTTIANTVGMDTAEVGSLLVDKATVNPDMTLHDFIDDLGKTTAMGLAQGAVMPILARPAEMLHERLNAPSVRPEPVEGAASTRDAFLKLAETGEVPLAKKGKNQGKPLAAFEIGRDEFEKQLRAFKDRKDNYKPTGEVQKFGDLEIKPGDKVVTPNDTYTLQQDGETLQDHIPMKLDPWDDIEVVDVQKQGSEVRIGNMVQDRFADAGKEIPKGKDAEMFGNVNQMPPTGLKTDKPQAADMLEGFRRPEEDRQAAMLPASVKADTGGYAALPRGTIEGGKEQIGDLYEYVKSKKSNAKQAVFYSRVGEEEGARLKQNLGSMFDLINYRHTIDNYGITHTIGEHSDPKTELPRGQLPVTKEDFLKIPEIIKNPDNVEYVGKDRIGRDLIQYTKRFNGTTLVFEEVREHREELMFHTMRKFKSPATSNAPLEGAPSPTSETLGGLSIKDISPSLSDVKPPEKLISIIKEIERIAAPGTEVRINDRIEIDPKILQDSLAKWGEGDLTKEIKIKGAHRIVTVDGEGLKSVIDLAMNYMNPKITPYHEAFHSVQEFLLTDGEKAVLEARYPERDGVSSHERQAQAFADYVHKTKGLPPVSVRKIFETIRTFLDSLGATLKGAGYKSPADIFEAAYNGELKKRAEGIFEQPTEMHAGIPIEKFTPGIEFGKDISQGIKSLTLPTAKSPEHLSAAETLGARLGEMHRKQEITGKIFENDSKMFDKAGVHKSGDLENNMGVKFMSDMSQGRSMNPKLQDVADRIKRRFQQRLDDLENAGVPVETTRENYFPGMWTKDSIRAFNGALQEAFAEGIGSKDTDINLWTKKQKDWVKDRAEQLLESHQGSEQSALSYLTKRPFEGKESFRKQKVFDDIMTGVEFGLRPVSNNPIDLVKLKLAEMDRSIMANKAINEWKDQGKVQFVALGKKVHEGFEKINDKYGTVNYRNEAGELITAGHYAAQKPVADILNNYLSSSLYNNRYFGTAYKAYMGIANALNQAQLGVGSAFHAGFTTAETVASGGANILKDVYRLGVGKGSIRNVIKSVGETVAAPLMNPFKGGEYLKEWLDPGAVDNPKVQQVAKAYELAGGKAFNERPLETHQTDAMIRDWYGGGKIKAAMRSPVAITELMARPIMKWLVPRQKMAVFGELTDRIIRDNPGKSMEELTPQFRQALNRVDARLGQVGYDRLFINNTAKNVIQGLVRAPGWSGGTVAEIGGSFKDTVSFVREWQKTGKAPEQLPDRVAYTLSLLIGAAAVNGALTYAFTGQAPQGMDYWAFRDGGKDEKGRPTRWLLPTYVKDIYAYYQNPTKTLGAKTHPILSMLNDMILRNKDYYGVEVRHPGDPYIKQGQDLALYGIKQFVPFWVRGVQKTADQGGGLLKTLQEHPSHLVGPELGIMPASSEFTKTPAEKLVDEFTVQRIPLKARTREEADKQQMIRDFEKRVRKSEDVAPDLAEKVREGVIGKADMQNILEAKKYTPLQNAFKRLTVEEALQVWDVANKEEQKELRPFMAEKAGSLKSKSRNEMEKYIPQIQHAIGMP